MPELVVGTAPENLKTDWWGGVWIGYATIGLVTLAFFVFQILRMVIFIRKCEKYKWQRCWVTESKEHKPTFSFFHFIFLGQAHQLSPDDKREILQHESIHVKRLHSVDIVLISLIKIIWWFHPVTYFIHQELTRLHEFEADAESVKNKDVSAYSGLLAKMALQDAGFSLGSRFTNSLIIKRINMMKTSKQNLKSWRIAAMACLALSLITFIGCQDQFTSKENKIDESHLPEDVATQLRRLRLISPASNFIALKFNNGREMDQYQRLHPKAYYAYGKVGKINYSIIEPDGVFESIPKNENEVFSVVDEVAVPVLGIKGFYEQLSYALQYPENARKNGVEGKVYIEFVVQTNGTVTDAKVIRGIDDEIDTEALRAFYQLGISWYPGIHQGQIVKMKMVLPIVFS
ncbi:MAG: TonB family protein, partial [Cytophagales bacterium]